jgi:hypothetical protein
LFPNAAEMFGDVFQTEAVISPISQTVALAGTDRAVLKFTSNAEPSADIFCAPAAGLLLK